MENLQVYTRQDGQVACFLKVYDKQGREYATYQFEFNVSDDPKDWKNNVPKEVYQPIPEKPKVATWDVILKDVREKFGSRSGNEVKFDLEKTIELVDYAKKNKIDILNLLKTMAEDPINYANNPKMAAELENEFYFGSKNNDRTKYSCWAPLINGMLAQGHKVDDFFETICWKFFGDTLSLETVLGEGYVNHPDYLNTRG